MTSRVGDMTLEELEQIINTIVDLRLRALFEPEQQDDAEALAWLDQNMWAPPPGAKSSLELLREDRDS